jgi:hypothetical protein
MQNPLANLLKLAACALGVAAMLPTTQAADKKADPTGTWTWSAPGRPGGGGGGGGGGQTRTVTAKLKADGDKLTGKVSMGGRQGGQARETDIENGKITGDEVSFQVTREFNNNKMTTKYHGKLSGDSIKGKMESERNGEPVSRDWEAKRGEEKKEDK